MAPPDPGDPSNPFQSLLGDLMNMLGTNGPNQWEMIRSFALSVATGGTPEANVEPIQRIRLEQLARVAELNVIRGHRHAGVVRRAPADLRAGGPGRLDPAGPRVVATAVDGHDPGADAAAHRRRTAPAATRWRPTTRWAGWAASSGSGPPPSGRCSSGSRSARWSGTWPSGPSASTPWPSRGRRRDELVLVTANIAAFAEDWSLPDEEALLWVCARELASHSVLSRPAVRNRLEELLTELAESSAAAQQDLAGKLGAIAGPEGPEDAAGMDLESLQGMFGDPEALLGELLTPESRRSSDQLTALAVVIDAYADHIADVVGKKLVGSHSQLAEAWYRRRTERGKGEEAAGALFGLDLEQSEVDRGRSFVSGVIERAGEDGLARLWVSVRNLPTPSEVDAPGLWLERISLPELEDPADS